MNFDQQTDTSTPTGPNRIDLLLEAERRGILPPDKQALLNEARKRNLLPNADRRQTSLPQEYSLGQKQAIAKANARKRMAEAERTKNVRMPDGTIINNVPEGTTKQELLSRYNKHRAQLPQMGKAEAAARGFGYGALQQPRDVIAAGYASLVGDMPFNEALQQAKDMSLAGPQGQAKKQQPGYFSGGQLAGNIAVSALPATSATKAVGTAAPALSKIPVAGRALSSMAKATSAGKGIVGVPAQGALEGAVSTAITEGDPASGAMGGGVGSGLMGLAGKVVRPVADEAISSARKGFTKLLQKEGIEDLTAAQLTGTPNLELADSVLANMIPTAGRARDRAERQLTQFTRAALRRAGIKADRVTPEALKAAEDSFSKRYNDLTKNARITIDDGVLDTIADVASKELDKLPTDVKPVVRSYIRDILQAGDEMTGAAYQTARSNMTQQIRSLSNRDPFTANTLRKVRNALDDAAERSLPEGKRGAWRQLNREYANFATIRKAAARTSQDSLEGLLSPAALLSTVQTANRKKTQAGYGDLYELARAGRSVLRDSVPTRVHNSEYWQRSC